ncbi:MAG: LLM class F420-dependent oxidoreductase [Myxococcales bacterium]|nr:LLM class F420-dependent oxidoreductase [Myxococcales bacterium]
MRFWQSLIFTETEQLLEIARTADDLGFTGVVLPDHVALPEHTETSYPYSDYELEPTRPFLDPWPAIASMAAVTTKLLFSTYVYVLPMRDPFSVAKSLATTALLTQGRVALGAGVGWLREEIELLGHDFESRGKRCDEMLEVMRMLFDEGSGELHGESFDFPRVHALPLPGHPIPIYIGGHSDAAVRRAARHDGWMGLDFPVDEVPALIERIRSARREIGRDSEPFEIFLSPRGQADRDTYQRLEDMGVTATLLPSWAMQGGDFRSLETKQKQMEATAAALFR